MGYQALKTIAESYPPQGRESLLGLAQEYRNRGEREVLEMGAIATDVSLGSAINLGREADANPQFLEAFRLQYPNVSLESLRGASEEQLDGWSNGAKGKYFEVLVRDRLNQGERLGEIHLLPGQVASLAESPTQAEWDLQITNADGSIAEEIQLKATESMAYVKQALERYPDIRVATTSEVDNAADEIIGTGISDEQLEKVTKAQIGELGEGTAEDLFDKGAEVILDSIPVMSVVLTGVIEGRNLLTGRYTLRESLRRGGKRIGRAAVYNALGAALGSTGVGIPVVMGLRVAEGRVTGRIALGDHLGWKTEELRQLAPQA
jgi:hypothetical protein